MGEMADLCNECEEYLLEYENGREDEGDYDEEYTPLSKRPPGPGKCPVCGRPTMPREGKFGKFFGCIAFPKCKGSRNCK